jgi:hypothetical protein
MQVNNWPVRLGVRTGDFHSSNRGSIPLRATKARTEMLLAFFISQNHVFTIYLCKMNNELRVKNLELRLFFSSFSGRLGGAFLFFIFSCSLFTVNAQILGSVPGKLYGNSGNKANAS